MKENKNEPWVLTNEVIQSPHICYDNPNYKYVKGKRPATNLLLSKFRSRYEAQGIDGEDDANLFRTYIPESLRWFATTILGSDSGLNFKIDQDKWQACYLEFDELENKFKKIGTGMVTPLTGKYDHINGEHEQVSVRLTFKHILHHLAHEHYRDELLKSKYYEVKVYPQKNMNLPVIIIDIDDLPNNILENNTEIYSAKNLARPGRKVNACIKDIGNCIGVEPIVFSSTSAPHRRHLYIQMEEMVRIKIKPDRLKALVQNALAPVFQKYEVDGFVSGEIEFLKYVTLPLGLNSQLYVKENGTYKVYRSKGGDGKRLDHSVRRSLEKLARDHESGIYGSITKRQRDGVNLEKIYSVL